MKMDWTFCWEEKVIHYCPLTLACSSQLEWKESLKTYFNLCTFLYFSGETRDKVPVLLPVEVTRKSLIGFCWV